MTTALPPVHLLVGPYTTESPEGRGRGLVSLRLDADPAGAVPVEVAVLPLPSPTYLVRHPDRPWLFAVTEAAPASVHSLALAPDGSLSLLSSVGTGGDAACHLALSPDGRHLLVAHYGSGSVASVPVLEDGRLGERQDLHVLTGSGPDPERQEAPHAHQVVWDGDEALVADLGTDRVHRLHLDPEGRLSLAGPPVVLPPGTGPRHLVVVADHLVVAGELSGELWLGRRDDDGGWQELDSTPCSTEPRDGPVHPSALRADGDQVVVANRGPGTLTVFTLDRGAGRLERQAEFGCGGSWPRDLVLGEGHLWVANQTDDVVTVFARDVLPPPGPVLEVAVPTPACVVLVPLPGR